ncbi:FecR domain-containing protein [Algoriphagus sp. AGSA1]|uniref:FecR family protein n=1 Tax=Algoriphagus sp. AGSA1 TaxID=2907213 RepID=UPI001F1CF07D|nr:FecR domain-containing protein [Algoriphagus sp. AGSA1]MCE7057290.1 FecR domain-containing protein [Algoriphagus sp. AGSA1]
MDFYNIRKEFYDGNLTQAEAQDFLNFLGSREAEELLSAEIIQLWSDQIKEGEPDSETTELWEKINLKKDSYPKSVLHKRTPIRKVLRLNWLRAAVVFLLMGLTTLFFVQNNQETNQTPGQELHESFITNSNRKGEKTKVTLEDGSVVYLNSQSSITYPENFKTNRYIQLEGEAYFEVTKDPGYPFRVEAEGIVTTALGTSFNISTFMEEEKVAVTLLTGKVKLNQDGRDDYLELSPGEESLLSPDIPRMEKYKVSAADRILWIEGILKFDEANLEEMVKVLERWYGVAIKVNGKPKDLSASGVFDNQESLRNVLTVMSQTLQFEFVMDDKMITLNFN